MWVTNMFSSLILHICAGALLARLARPWSPCGWASRPTSVETVASPLTSPAMSRWEKNINFSFRNIYIISEVWLQLWQHFLILYNNENHTFACLVQRTVCPYHLQVLYIFLDLKVHTVLCTLFLVQYYKQCTKQF